MNVKKDILQYNKEITPSKVISYKLLYYKKNIY